MPKDGSPEILTTTVDAISNWARKNSLWPLPFGTSCCGIEMMAVLSSDYDMSRFGAEVVRFSPRQADLIICAGTITLKMAPVLKNIYEQMAEPKWVMAFGVCTSSGGIYNAYPVLQGIDTIIPVDVYIPGCPPSPEGVIHGLMQLQKRIQTGEYSRASRARGRELGPLASRGGQKT
ncbi:MAG: NADH-quinone oxidoreductase subunit NuoB [Deltaproteobacteria bacterium]|nr:NADH-quinone oxidoreductase subunit NuoB [Deltaproteobacteria bacterium]